MTAQGAVQIDPTDELCDCSLTEIAEVVRRRTVSPAEVTEAVLRRIERLDPRLNAFISVLAEQARREAARATAEILAGRYHGPLHGLPVSVKDIFETAGVRTTAGSRILADHVPTRNATVVDRLAAAGAILIGKTNLLEFAYGTVHPDYGPSRNPWDPDYSAGGSSSGSAVAVAAGLGFGSIGSDTGGSVRIPAAFCGVVGLKPTYDRVSREGLIPLSRSTDHVGPIARTVADAALLFAAIADTRPSDDDPFVLETAASEAATGLQGVRIGIDDAYLSSHVAPEVLRVVERALAVLADLGGTLIEVSLPPPETAVEKALTIRMPEATAAHAAWLQTRPGDYSPAVRERLEAGLTIPAVRYLDAVEARAAITAAVLATFRRVDLLVTPTVPIAAPSREDDPTLGAASVGRTAHLIRFTAPFSLTGLPAVTVSCGFTEAGLPVGLQFVAPPNAEAALLRAARAYEEATKWHAMRLDLTAIGAGVAG